MIAAPGDILMNDDRMQTGALSVLCLPPQNPAPLILPSLLAPAHRIPYFSGLFC